MGNFDGNINIQSLQITNNTLTDSIIDIDGITSLNASIKHYQQQFINGTLFNGLKQGDVTMSEIVFSYNNLNDNMDGEILMNLIDLLMSIFSMLSLTITMEMN